MLEGSKINENRGSILLMWRVQNLGGLDIGELLLK